jgi:hypothetical protein
VAPFTLILVIHTIFAPVPSMGQQVKLTTKERMERMGNFESSSLTRPTGCSRRFDPIHLSNGSSGPSAGSIWTVCSFGRQMTWYESWSCSKSSTTRRVYTKGYPATRPGRKRAAQPLNPPASHLLTRRTHSEAARNLPDTTTRLFPEGIRCFRLELGPWLGEAIRAKRMKARWSQKRLAEKADLSTISCAKSSAAPTAPRPPTTGVF